VNIFVFKENHLLGFTTVQSVGSQPKFRGYISPPSAGSNKSSKIPARLIRPWRWRRYVPPKLRLTFNGPHGVISQKIVLFISTAVRTSNPTTFFLNITAYTFTVNWNLLLNAPKYVQYTYAYHGCYRRYAYTVGFCSIRARGRNLPGRKDATKEFLKHLENLADLHFIYRSTDMIIKNCGFT
jgi:hypothetical protein